MFRRGLSELLGLLIMIVLVIGIGALLFTYSSNLFRSRIQETSIDVSIQYGDNYSILNLKVTNLGTSEISKVNIYSEYLTKGGDTINYTYNKILKSGSSMEVSISVDQFSKIPVPVKVIVFFVDGGKIEKQFYIYPEYTG